MNEANKSGRDWAHAGLIGTLLVSTGANVAHVLLAVSDLHWALRLPNGVFWPVVTFVAIEVVVRMVWPGKWMDILARVIMFGSMIPTVFVSYGHQYHLLGLMGESDFLKMVGPIGIDGFMVGFTMTLLATSARITERHAEAATLATPVLAEAEIPEPAPIEIPAPVAPPALPEPEPVRGAVRRAAGDLGKAIQLLMDGQDTKSVAVISGVAPATVRSYAALVRTLREDPHAQVPPSVAGRVKREVVDEVRTWARQGASR
jgi:hypothetical protein